MHFQLPAKAKRNGNFDIVDDYYLKYTCTFETTNYKL